MRARTSRFRPTFDALDGRLLLSGGGTTAPATATVSGTSGTMPGDDVDLVGSTDTGSSSSSSGNLTPTTSSSTS